MSHNVYIFVLTPLYNHLSNDNNDDNDDDDDDNNDDDNNDDNDIDNNTFCCEFFLSITDIIDFVSISIAFK